MAHRNEKIRSLVMNAAAKFIVRESNGQSLITVTDVRVSEKGDDAVVLVSVMPAETQEKALAFLQRKTQDFWEFLTGEMKARRLPTLSFEIDQGEINRQKIEGLIDSTK